MKNKNLPLILLVIVLLFGLLAAIYVSGTVPNYNGVIDTIFSDIAGLFGGKEKVHTAVSDVTAVSETPVSSTGKKAPEKALSSDIYEILDKGYTLSSAGKNRWYFESSWPIITEPLNYDGKLILITAEPAFIVLSYDTGDIIAKQECPVYPTEKAGMEGSLLTLVGRDGQSYRFQIESDLRFTDMRQHEEDDESMSFLSLLKPDQKSVEAITKRLREWTADDERTLPELQVFIGHINREGNGNFYAEKNADTDTMLYVFTPDKQGIYQIGLADENGVWIQANAFVAVFGENGDMKQVSIDYVANKPQVKLHLSETEIYYIVAGWAKDMYDGQTTWLQIAESH